MASGLHMLFGDWRRPLGPRRSPKAHEGKKGRIDETQSREAAKRSRALAKQVDGGSAMWSRARSRIYARAAHPQRQWGPQAPWFPNRVVARRLSGGDPIG